MGDEGGPTILDYTTGAVQEALDYLSEVEKRLWPLPHAGATAVSPYVPLRVRRPESSAPQEWEALRGQRRRVVILGPPGTGKTTLLRVEGGRWAQEEAARLRAGRSGTVTLVLPIFIPLKALAAEEGELEEAIVTFVQRHYLRVNTRLGAPYTHEFSPRFWALLRERLRAGRCVLLLDALDEVEPEHKREALRQRFLRFAANYTCPFLLTSRPGGYKELDFLSAGGEGVPEWELVAWSREQVQTLIDQWFASRPEVAQQLGQEVQHNLPMRSLTQVPLLAVLICQALQDGKLQPPVRPENLYQQCVDGLWRVWQKKNGPGTLPEDTRKAALEYLARRFRPQQELPKTALHTALREFLGTTHHLRDRSHEDLLKELSDAGILVQRGIGAAEAYSLLHPRCTVDPDAVTGSCSTPRPDDVDLEGIVLDADSTRRLMATAHRPGRRAQMIDYLVSLVGAMPHRREDPAERYWIYVALGELGAQAESPLDRAKATAAVQQGLSDDHELARRGAVAACSAFGHSS